MERTSTHAAYDASRYERFAAGLEVAGLKLTSQRRAICQVLAGMPGVHPTAYEVHEAARAETGSVSLATVYNTLTALRDLGLVYELGSARDGVVHYELDTGPHLNLLCVRCHRIDDLPEQMVDRIGDVAAERSGFRVLGARLLFYGHCPECRRKEQAPGS